jgi:hypothetical protein
MNDEVTTAEICMLLGTAAAPNTYTTGKGFKRD